MRLLQPGRGRHQAGPAKKPSQTLSPLPDGNKRGREGLDGKALGPLQAVRLKPGLPGAQEQP